MALGGKLLPEGVLRKHLGIDRDMMIFAESEGCQHTRNGTEVHKKFVHLVGAYLPQCLGVIGHDPGRGVDGQELTVLNQTDAVALVGLVHIRRGDYNAQFVPGFEFLKHLPELFSAHRVDARGGFVEKEHTGRVDECAAQSELLLHASGKFPRLALLEWLYLSVDILHKVVVLVYGGVEYGGEEGEIFLYGEVLIKGETARHISDILADFLVITHYIEAVDHCGARFGKQQRCQDAEERCLAGAVRSDESENLALGNLERHTFQGLDSLLALAVGDLYVVYTYYSHGRASLEFDVAVHAALYLSIVLHVYLDGIYKVGTLVTCLYGLGGELCLAANP